MTSGRLLPLLTLYVPDLLGSYPYFGSIYQRLHRILPTAKITGVVRVIPQYDSGKVHVHP